MPEFLVLQRKDTSGNLWPEGYEPKRITARDERAAIKRYAEKEWGAEEDLGEGEEYEVSPIMEPKIIKVTSRKVSLKFEEVSKDEA